MKRISKFLSKCQPILSNITPLIGDLIQTQFDDPQQFRNITGRFITVHFGQCNNCGHCAVTKCLLIDVNDDCPCCQNGKVVDVESTNLYAIPHSKRFCKNKPENCKTAYSHKFNVTAINRLVEVEGLPRTKVIQTLIDTRNDPEMAEKILKGGEYDIHWLPQWFNDLLSQPQPGSQSQIQPGPQSQPQPGPQSQIQPGPQSQPQPGPQSQIQPSSQSQPILIPDHDPSSDYLQIISTSTSELSISNTPSPRESTPRELFTNSNTPSPRESTPREQLTRKSKEELERLYFIEPNILDWIPESHVGRGTYGIVQLAIIKGIRSPFCNTVACKVIEVNNNNPAGNTKKLSELVLREIENMGALVHQNILKFYGYTYKDDVKLVIVMEFMEMRSLVDNKDILDDLFLCLKIAIQIVDAMVYMHSKGFIHRDLTPSNILLTGHITNLTAKVGDLGLCRMQINPEDHTSSVGQIRYMAPEVLEISKTFTTKSDVYSFGMVLWYMLVKEQPFKDFDQQDVITKIKNGERPIIPDSPFKSLIEKCFEHSGESRPAFEEIQIILKQILY